MFNKQSAYIKAGIAIRIEECEMVKIQNIKNVQKKIFFRPFALVIMGAKIRTNKSKTPKTPCSESMRDTSLWVAIHTPYSSLKTEDTGPVPTPTTGIPINASISALNNSALPVVKSSFSLPMASLFSYRFSIIPPV